MAAAACFRARVERADEIDERETTGLAGRVLATTITFDGRVYDVPWPPLRGVGSDGRQSDANRTFVKHLYSLTTYPLA
jgi:hypothetical protein